MHFDQLAPENLAENAKIPLQLYENSPAVFEALARCMVEEITQNEEKNKHTVIICPVGPVGQYPYFVEMVNTEKLSLKNTWFINMDEYLTENDAFISKENKLSFRAFMKREVYGKIDEKLVMPREQQIFPDPQNITHIPKLLQTLGGVDLTIGGIGINGHLAFNEPEPEISIEVFAKLPTRVLNISPETRSINASMDLGGSLLAMPRRAVTVGMAEILSSKKIRLGCFREWHRAVVRRAAHGEMTTDFPVTLLQNHPDACILVNDVAAKQAY